MTDGDQTVISWPGYMYGDGLSSKKLYCNHKRKISEATVTKYLFRIEPPRKYYHKKLLQEAKKNRSTDTRALIKNLADSDADYANIKAEYCGMPVAYGQAVIIRHLFSNSFVSLEINKTAKLIGNMQLSLVSDDNEYTNMIILPLSKLTKIGMPISYTHDIIIANLRERRYFIHASEFLNSRDEGLEINGSELKTEWRPQLFMSNKKYASLYNKGNTVHPNQIIHIFNTSMQGSYLSASKVSLSNMSYTAQLVTTGGNSRQLLYEIPMQYTCIKEDVTVSSEVISSEIANFYTLWEVQKVSAFDSKPIQYFKHKSIEASEVRLKNVATQCYLSVDPHDTSRLILTRDGLNKENIFHFCSRSMTSETGIMRKGDHVKIRNSHGRFIQPMKITKTEAPNKGSVQDYLDSAGLQSKSKVSIGAFMRDSGVNEQSWEHKTFGCSTRSDPSEATFEIIGGSSYMVKTVNMLSSVYGHLLSFYQYLEDWAVSFRNNNTQGIQSYNYELAEKYEKELESEIDLLTQSLSAIYEFLCETRHHDSHQTDFNVGEGGSILSQLTIDQAENYESTILSEMNILQLLLSILELINFKTIDTLLAAKNEKDDEEANRKLVSYATLKSSGLEKFTLVPQTIARNRLDRTVALIIKVLALSALDNKQCSYLLSKNINIFENSLEFRSSDIIELGSIIAESLYCEENTFSKFYMIWTKLLEDVTEKRGGNIKKQCMILQLFTGLTENINDDSKLSMVQKRLVKSLYTDKQSYRNLKMVKFMYNSSADVVERQLLVCFVIATSSRPYLQRQRTNFHRE